MSNWQVQIPITTGMQSSGVLHWLQKTDSVHLEIAGWVDPGMSWDEFMQRVEFLKGEREKHQREAEGGQA